MSHCERCSRQIRPGLRAGDPVSCGMQPQRRALLLLCGAMHFACIGDGLRIVDVHDLIFVILKPTNAHTTHPLIMHCKLAVVLTARPVSRGATFLCNTMFTTYHCGTMGYLHNKNALLLLLRMNCHVSLQNQQPSPAMHPGHAPQQTAPPHQTQPPRTRAPVTRPALCHRPLQ